MLAAATEWGVPASALVAKESVITHAASKRRTTYGAMAAKATKIQLPDPAKLKDRGEVRSELGNIDTAMGQGVKIIEATYSVPFLNHACMEPHSATVIATANRVDIWTGAQSPDVALRYVAQEAGIAPENVYVHTMLMGGGYGIDNQNPRAFQQAVAVAKTLNGRPVKLLWSREEDWGFGLRPRPMGIVTFKAAVDAAGYPIAIEVRTVGQNYGGDQQWRGLSAWPYYVPNYRYTTTHPQSHVPCVPRRATGSSTNAFYQGFSFVNPLTVKKQEGRRPQESGLRPQTEP